MQGDATWPVWGYCRPGWPARTYIIAAPTARAAARVVGDVPAVLWVVEAPDDMAAARARPGVLLVWAPEEAGYQPADDVLGLRLTPAGWESHEQAQRLVEAVYGPRRWRDLERQCPCPAGTLTLALPLVEAELTALRDEGASQGEIAEAERLLAGGRAAIETAYSHRVGEL